LNYFKSVVGDEDIEGARALQVLSLLNSFICRSPEQLNSSQIPCMVSFGGIPLNSEGMSAGWEGKGP